MTDFSFDFFIPHIPIKLISKFPLINALLYWKIWLFTGCVTEGCVHDIHLGNILHGPQL